jgi:hypothetical protein
MIADVNDADFALQWMPCRIFDATGAEIHRVVWADTITGEVAQLAMPDEDGRYRLVVNDAGQEVAALEWGTRPAPLRLERNGSQRRDDGRESN